MPSRWKYELVEKPPSARASYVSSAASSASEWALASASESDPLPLQVGSLDLLRVWGATMPPRRSLDLLRVWGATMPPRLPVATWCTARTNGSPKSSGLPIRCSDFAMKSSRSTFVIGTPAMSMQASAPMPSRQRLHLSQWVPAAIFMSVSATSSDNFHIISAARFRYFFFWEKSFGGVALQTFPAPTDTLTLGLPASADFLFFPAVFRTRMACLFFSAASLTTKTGTLSSVKTQSFFHHG
mmetsp:Transcript_24133/g.69352  ORF Transcript_24133/g.69352 Transcript_24133/m.69352 type:complete len:241 (-) Transcript_24133:1241-1963(-)